VKRTSYIFLVLIIGSWIIELLIGARIVYWYWGTNWQTWAGIPYSTAEIIALLSGGRFNLAGIGLFCLWIYFGLHAVRVAYGLYGPILQRWKLGARSPSQREREHFEAICASLTRQHTGQVSRPYRWKVADGLGMQARWVGYVLVVDRELLNHRFFAAVLAHHLGHTNSEDRLAHRLYAMLPPTRALAGIIVGLPFAIGHVLLFPFWAWYWRERVFAADLFAVRLGQGPALLKALDELYIKLDQSTKGGRLLKPVPYIEERINRIKGALAQVGPQVI